MDRREFVRRIVLVGVMGAVGGSGVYALAQKLLSAPAHAPTLLNAQSPGANSSSTAATETVTVTVTNNQGSQTGGSGNNTSQTSTTANSSQAPPSGYILLAPLSAVSGKTYAYFNHPTGGTSILVNYNGTWKAFSAICTHAGCTLNYTSSELYCPCHNGYFSAVNGSVLGGPPPRPVAEYGIQIINGNIYVSSNVIN